MGCLYVVGLPLGVFGMLWVRRGALFGESEGAVATRARYGFLYESYGVSGWWWEVEELVRKLLLTSIVVVMSDGSPLQVTCAVCVCSWAHVLHGVFKPWGGGSLLYGLQHGSLFVTSFVFLMGLLFKVDGVVAGSAVYDGLAVVMLVLCCGYVAVWCGCMVAAMVRSVVVRRRRGVLRTSGDCVEVLHNDTVAVGSVGGVVDSEVDDGKVVFVVNPLRSLGGGLSLRDRVNTVRATSEQTKVRK